MSDPYYDRLQRVRILITLKRYGEAMRTIDDLLMQKEDQVLFYYKMSILYRSERFDELRKTADYAVSRFPDSLSMRLWHLIGDMRNGDVLAMADIMPSIDHIATSEKQDDGLRFPDAYAQRFYESVRFLKDTYGKTIMNMEPENIVNKIVSDRIPENIRDGLYTSHFDKMDKDLQRLTGNSRSFYMLSRGRIGDAFLDMMRMGQTEIYRKFMVEKFIEFYRQTEAQKDPFVMCVRYHLMRLKERSLQALDMATNVGFLEKSIARIIIESESNVLASSEVPQMVQVSR
ncbi:hypothetical protein [Thermoplasma sp.]|uniref:hypothetical protein n=1 Tax=Thermoplasma sp. TaxID=1973142 RepID=UPI00127B80A4|nr:hypothetical protein [Thermoplasma sp.]KAA8922458.1 MAG: hypothetical protein F6Q11_04380 [Thermoplasma sp.]